MTEPNIPDPIEKRDQIYGENTTPDQLKDLGDRFFKAGYYPDALEAYVEGDIQDGGERVLERAVEQGNYFLVQKIDDQWPDLVDGTVWEEAGENAEEAGRLTDAVKLYYAGDYSDDRKRVEEQLEEELGHTIPAVVRADTADAKEKDELDEEGE